MVYVEGLKYFARIKSEIASRGKQAEAKFANLNHTELTRNEQFLSKFIDDDELLIKTKITKLEQALKGTVKSYEIVIKIQKDPLLQLNHINKDVETLLKSLLVEMKGFKLLSKLKITFKKPKGDNTLYETVYFNSKPQILSNDTNIDESLGLTTQELLNKIGQWLSEGYCWIIDRICRQALFEDH